jgi:hypothetical protein
MGKRGGADAGIGQADGVAVQPCGSGIAGTKSPSFAQVPGDLNDALAALDSELPKLHAFEGRPSMAPKKLFRASLLQAFYTVRSERQLVEQL